MAIRINRLLLSAMGCFTIAPVAMAQSADKINNFSVAPEISSYEYKEPGVMKLSGAMYGLTAEYLNNGGIGRISESKPIQLRARITYMQGKLDYDGFIQNLGGTVTPHQTKEDNHFYDMMLAAGMEAKMGSTWSVAPYLGIGYRALVDKSDGDPANYKRNQTYLYLPLGADWKAALAGDWQLALNSELDILLRGDNTSYTDHILGENLKFRQKSGYGLKASVRFQKNTQSTGFFIEPFYRYWNINKSNTQYVSDGVTQYGFVEPKNRTQEFGLRVGVSF